MDNGPLVNEEIEAGAELVREFNHYAPVKAAFWLKKSERAFRYLYIASEKIDGSNFDLGYGEVLRLVANMNSPYLNPFRVKIVGSQNPLAKAASEISSRYNGRFATRLGGDFFGGTSVDDVYIYPSPLTIEA